MSNSRNNFTILCRLCLAEDGNIPIFPDEDNKESDLSERIFQCVSIRVNKRSKLPLNICSGCITNLESWSSFRIKCHQSQAVLTSLAKGSQEKDSGVYNGTDSTPANTSNSHPDGVPGDSERLPSDDNHVVACDTTEKSQSNDSHLGDELHQEDTNDDESAISPDEPMEVEDDEDDDDGSELASKQLVNPKFACKLLKSALESSEDQDSDEVRIIAPTSVLTVDLCDEDDDDVDKNEDAAVDDQTSIAALTASGTNQDGLRIASAITLPVGELFEGEEDALKEASECNEEPSNQMAASRSSQGESPDRMSASGSALEREGDPGDEDDLSQDESSLPLPASDADGDFSQATLDSTMVDGNAEEPEPFVPVSLADIKKEIDRGYADEDGAEALQPYKQQTPQSRSREEYERQALAADHTVDADNQRCIICDHKFHSLTSLLRHTKCKTHIINRSITMKREAGAPVDPRLMAQHERNMMSYKKQWNSGKRRNYPSLGTKSGKFTCKLCNVVHISARDLERHRQSKKHKLYSLMGGPPPEVDPPKRKIVKPQHLQYKHDEAPQHLISNRKMNQMRYEREYICPIPNCGYVCYDGSILLTHMTSHGIQGQALQQAQSTTQAASPKVNSAGPAAEGNAYTTNRYPQSRYENLFCPYHNAYFDTARGYLNHIRSCTMAPPISSFLKKEHQTTEDRYCKLCDINFSSHDMFVQHLRVYHKGSSIQQEQDAGKMKVNAPVFTPKMSSQAKSNRKHKCHICGRTFNLLHSLNFHLRSHQQNSGQTGRPICKVCKKSFATRKACASHLKTHFLPPGSNKLFCSACYKTFDTRTEICRHRFDGTCLPVPPQQFAGNGFPCDQCNSTFNDRNTLNQHISRYHPEVKKEKVDDNYENDSKFSAGYEQADEDEETAPTDLLSVSYQAEPVYCILCEKNFPTYEMMRKHCRFVHRMPEDKIKKMAFADGGDSLSSQHFISTPPQSQSKTCGNCGESFTNMKLFNSHLQVCSNTGFSCPSCGLATDGQGCPNCDPQTSETNEVSLLFKCPIGHMSFNDENSMLKHYSYCTGNCGPYFECGSCGGEFKYRKNFDVHDCALTRRKVSHECSECKRSFSKKTYLLNHELKCPGINSGEYPSESTSQPPPPSNPFKKTRRSGPIEEEPQVTISRTKDTAQEPAQVFPCDQCEKVFHSQKALNGHGWVHKKPSSEDQMFCKFCGRENLQLSNLYPHIYKCVRSLFLTEEVLTCDDCSTFLSRYDSPKDLSSKLHNHVLNCYPIPWYQNEGDVDGSDKLLCYICCHAFASVESLTIHKEQHKRARAKRNSPFLKSVKKRPRPSSSSSNLQGFPTPKLDFDINEMIEEEIPNEMSEESCASESTSSTSIATKFIMNCQVCNRQFYNIDKLRNHEKVHGIVRQLVSSGEGSREEKEDDMNKGEEQIADDVAPVSASIEDN